jgi:HEPN domain-containing protein
MYFDNYAPWEHHPKTLSHKEILNPLTVVMDFFSTDSLKGHKRDLKEWRTFVTTGKHFDDERHSPGSLLFTYDLNLKLLEAVYLVWLNYRNNHWNYKKVSGTQLQEEQELWVYFPKNLKLKEQANPYKAVKQVFKKVSPQQYREYLHEWLHFALYNNPADETLMASEVIMVYENLLKLYSAVWLIHQRETEQTKFKKDLVNDQKLDLSQLTVKVINPDPTAAEKLALEEIKNLILKKCPQVQMIIHLGTHPEPFTFYLLILIGDEEKTPEHEVGNKIEDNCHYLARVHAIVHKANSAKEALNVGRRFWSTVIEKGFIVYQSPELTLPEHKEITKEILIERAKFNWERWGVQGKEFLKGAELYRADSNFRLAAFLLHQSVESVLKAIIQAILGYRVQMHNLSRLLRLSLLFSNELKNVFDLSTTEGTQIFTLLQNSYSQSRYNSSFDPDEESIRIMAKRVALFHCTAESIYLQFLRDIK